MVEVSATIECKSRTVSGKGASHKLRAEGVVPAVAYGPGSQPRHLTLDPHVFGLQKKQFGRSHIYDVAVDGGKGFKALLKGGARDDKGLHLDLDDLEMDLVLRFANDVRMVLATDLGIERNLDDEPPVPLDHADSAKWALMEYLGGLEAMLVDALSREM